MGLLGLLTSKPAQALAKQAAKAAGQWVKDKVVSASHAAVEKARQAADAVDRAARDTVRSGIHKGTDAGSDAVGAASEAYQGAKAKLVAGADRIGQAVDGIKKRFGMEPANAPKAPCPKCAAAGEAPDGSLLVPSDDCPADAISRGPGGIKEALAKAKAASSPSKRDCCARKSAAERNRTIVYVNGVNTSPEAHCKTLRNLQNMTCGKVIGVLNRGEGLATDAIRTNDARLRIKREIGGGPANDYAGFSPAVTTMKDVMTLQAASGEPTTIFAHSEGGAITSLAAIRAKTTLAKGGMPGAMGNLDVVSMGAAAPAWPDGPNYTHYIHVQDVVPNALGLGDAAQRPGAGANVVRFGGREGKFYDVTGNDKKPYLPVTPINPFKGRVDPIADHYADSSYLPYINAQSGGCLDTP